MYLQTYDAEHGTETLIVRDLRQVGEGVRAHNAIPVAFDEHLTFLAHFTTGQCMVKKPEHSPVQVELYLAVLAC